MSSLWLPQEITRDVLFPWWRAFRVADENVFLWWMQDFDFDCFYDVKSLLQEICNEYYNNMDVYQLFPDDHPFRINVVDIHDILGMYAGGIMSAYTTVPEMRKYLDVWNKYKFSVVIPFRNNL
jgi:hypothetical protein